MLEACPGGHPKTVVLVDEEHLIRVALSRELSAHGVQVVGEAACCDEAVERLVACRPDVVLIDPVLPGKPGCAVIERLARVAEASRILVLTRFWHGSAVEAILAGACGYIPKSSPTEAIAGAVKAAAAGEWVLSPIAAEQLVRHIQKRDTPATARSPSAAAGIRASLTTRELDVLMHLAAGMSNCDIGRELMLSSSTVSNHVASILAKLHLENRVQAAVQAVRSGIC